MRGWEIFIRRTRAGNLGEFPQFIYYNRAIRRPRESFRAKVEKINGDCVKLNGWAHDADYFDSPSQTRLLKDMFNIRKLLNSKRSSFPDTDEILSKAIADKHFVLVSDGSFMKHLQYGTAGWVAEKRNDIHITKGNLISPGPAHVQCSHRSELAGIMAGLCYVVDLCQTFNVTSGGITIGCDGLGAIEVISKTRDTKYTIKNNRKHFDLLATIKQLTKYIPNITINFTHVKGHQDDENEYHELDRLSQLNVLADEIAGDMMKAQTSLGLPRLNWLPCDPCPIYIVNREGDQVRICSHLLNTLRDEVTKKKIRNYWSHKHKYDPRQEKLIDWELFARSRNMISKTKATWGSKWLTDFCGVRKMLHRQRYQAHSKCPRCNKDDEDVLHVIQCKDVGATALWNQEVDDLYKWMIDNGGESNLCQIIRDSLHS